MQPCLALFLVFSVLRQKLDTEGHKEISLITLTLKAAISPPTSAHGEERLGIFYVSYQRFGPSFCLTAQHLPCFWILTSSPVNALPASQIFPRPWRTAAWEAGLPSVTFQFIISYSFNVHSGNPFKSWPLQDPRLFFTDVLWPSVLTQYGFTA